MCFSSSSLSKNRMITFYKESDCPEKCQRIVENVPPMQNIGNYRKTDIIAIIEEVQTP